MSMRVSRIDLLLKEYEALRSEIVTTMSNRGQILAFGLAGTTGLLAAAGLGNDAPERSYRSVMALISVGIPVLSLLVLSLWLGEFSRMTRAGAHVAKLEKRLNRLAQGRPDPDLLLTWEQHRWEVHRTEQLARSRCPSFLGSRLMTDAYLPVQCWFGLLILTAPVLGVWFAGGHFGRFWYLCAPWGAAPWLYLQWRFVHNYRLVSYEATKPYRPSRGHGRRALRSPAKAPVQSNGGRSGLAGYSTHATSPP